MAHVLTLRSSDEVVKLARLQELEQANHQVQVLAQNPNSVQARIYLELTKKHESILKQALKQAVEQARASETVGTEAPKAELEKQAATMMDDMGQHSQRIVVEMQAAIKKEAEQT